MRYLLLLTVLFVLHAPTANAQSLQAEYTVTFTIKMDLDGGDVHRESITLKGFLYRKGNRYIYFERPAYLNKYPDGAISVSPNPYHTYSFSLNTDTIQSINYYDFDSLVYRRRVDQLSTLPNRIQNFDPNYYQWVFLTDTKEINGLHCQKATLTLHGIPQWELWFCPDIPMQAGVENIMGVPGLVVDAESIPDHRHYTLDSYDTNGVVQDSLFWPQEFNQPFDKRSDLYRGTVNDRPSRPSKKQELLKQ
ncbi:GLPGLI family protein [Chitinophaga costaii]|uniref:GLPGLI family protein n=1 Tax=Chitinophaga costaii TaxID=1335309 RepID=A0A1C3YNW4_9BACT|nr:GLPGLI family protein [Chitinophaga costaii]SCB71789.1 GLPGLI family protein [Chitinophaga costaii]